MRSRRPTSSAGSSDSGHSPPDLAGSAPGQLADVACLAGDPALTVEDLLEHLAHPGLEKLAVLATGVVVPPSDPLELPWVEVVLVHASMLVRCDARVKATIDAPAETWRPFDVDRRSR